jgi:hypothetical protein
MSNFYKGPAIDASYQVSIHFAKRFQRRFFKIGQSETRIAYGGHVCVSDWLISKKLSPLKPFGQMNRNLVGSFLGRSSINLAHLVPICLQTWLPQTILVSDWLISKVHLAKRFQRRSFKKSANQKQKLTMAAIFVNGSGQNEQSLERTFHRHFLLSFTI